MRLAAESDLTVVGEAADCHTALELARYLKPDVVLVDLEGRQMDEVRTASEQICAICEHAAVVVMSMHADTLERTWAEHTPVAAYVAKFVPVEVLLATIRRVAAATQPTARPLLTGA
jgi:DNA-binding NarL/FixJ family response regulator